MSLVAVYVSTKGKWVVDAAFTFDDSGDTLDNNRLVIIVAKLSPGEKSGKRLLSILGSLVFPFIGMLMR